jgi:hypothetical protein
MMVQWLINTVYERSIEEYFFFFVYKAVVFLTLTGGIRGNVFNTREISVSSKQSLHFMRGKNSVL